MEKNLSELYAPQNAKNLKSDEVLAMKGFAIDQLKELAHAHPNKSGTTYLLLGDKNVAENKQLHPLSTWNNLYQLHKQGQTQYYAAGFKNIARPQGTAKSPVAEVQDITKDEAKKAVAEAGKVTAPPQTPAESSKQENVKEPAAFTKYTTAAAKKLSPDELKAAYTLKTGLEPGKLTKPQLVAEITK